MSLIIYFCKKLEYTICYQFQIFLYSLGKEYYLMK